jgi:hypothetical protein
MDIENMLSIHNEYYLVIKKNEIKSFSRKWMELEILKLSETTQIEKDKYYMFSLISGI